MTAPAMRVSTEVPRTLCSSQCRKTSSYKTVFGGTLKDNVVVRLREDAEGWRPLIRR